jgi:RNA polymerase sigma factor (TIGR02999 family)
VPSDPSTDVTAILEQWRAGKPEAREQLMDVVYAELRRLARIYLSRERASHTLQPTALVNEAYMRLVDQRLPWQSRAHFLGIAAQMMRRVLVDHARSRKAGKRGGDALKVTLSAAEGLSASNEIDLIALDAALDRLAALDARQSRIVELRYFGDLTNEQTAEALDLSPATVKREWTVARAWLKKALSA